jgi:hypothetical protein
MQATGCADCQLTIPVLWTLCLFAAPIEDGNSSKQSEIGNNKMPRAHYIFGAMPHSLRIS